MIKLSLNSTEATKSPASDAQAPFSSALAAAVQAAGAAPTQVSVTAPTSKRKQKAPFTPAPSNGLLSRGIGWLQAKGRGKKRLHMIETVSLGEKRFVALVKVDGREFLLGGAPSSVGMLADLGAHGLGDLLSLPSATEAARPEPQVSNTTFSAVSEPVVLPLPATATAVAALPEATEPAPVVAADFELPITQVGPTAPGALTTPAFPAAKLNVMVEADEDESDWLMQDETELPLRSAMKAEPIPQANAAETIPVGAPEPEIAKPAAIFMPEVVEIAAPVQKAGPVAVPSTAPAPRLDLNFTFQMWPSSTSSVPAATSVIEDHAAFAVPAIIAPKVKRHIDLESCPELLAEPYLLALVENTRGAAA